MPDTKQRNYVVRDSDIHGRGVFAANKIRKGTTIIEYKGDRTSWDVASLRPDSDPDNPYHTFIFELSDGRVIDAGVGGNAARWINHSCDPNLTYDYRLSYDGRVTRKVREAFACRCGTEACRGTMLLDKKKKKRKAARKK